MLPALILAAAYRSFELPRPWLTFTREPVLERNLTTIDVGPLQNAQRERIFLFVRSVGHGDNIQISWADTKTCPAAMWVVEEAINVPPPRIHVPGVKDPTAGKELTLTMDGVAYSLSSGARYGSGISSTIRMTSNWGTPLANWVDESLRRLQPCWKNAPPQS
jgi:hypothetical protein